MANINLNEKELAEKNLGQETGVSSTEGKKPEENDTTKITKSSRYGSSNSCANILFPIIFKCI